MKKKLAGVILCLGLLMSLCACLDRSANEDIDNDDRDEGVTTIVTEVDPEEAERLEQEREAEEEAAREAERKQAYEDAVDELLDDYREVLETGVDAFDESTYPEIPYYSIQTVRYSGTIYYGYYDFDENGTDELILATGDEEFKQPIGIYAFDGTKMVYLCKEQSLGERATIHFQNGLFTIHGSISASSGVVLSYKLADDGYSIDIQDWYMYEYDENDELTVTTEIGNMDEKSYDQDTLNNMLDQEFVEIDYTQL